MWCIGILCLKHESIGEDVVVHEISFERNHLSELLLLQKIRILKFDVFLFSREEQVDGFTFSYDYLFLTFPIYDSLVFSEDEESCNDSSLSFHKTQYIAFSLEKQSAIASE